jgi:type II secretory pathway component PulK
MSRNSNKKGLVLVAVLWLVVVLMAIVAVLGRKARLDMKVSQSMLEGIRCKWACRGGIEKAIGVLNEDTRESDSLIDTWSDNDADFNNVALEGCLFNVQVIDEASKLNINTATKEQLMGLQYMTEDVADAIIDWRDSDDVPSNTGVESGYYENLPYGYRIRNGPFRTIRELLLVKGVTEELFYGEEGGISNYEYRPPTETFGGTNNELRTTKYEQRKGWAEYLTCYSVDSDKDASGNSRININNANQNELESSLGISSAQARWIVNNRRNRYASIADLVSQSSSQQSSGTTRNDPNAAEPVDMQTFYQIADKITTSSGGNVQGRVNINTASDVVLTALLGGGDEAEQIAVSIVNYRNNLAAGMQSIAEVLQAGLMNIDTFRRVANYLTTRSDVFTVRCFATVDRGVSNGETLQTEAVVDRSANPCEVLYWYEGVSN